MKETMADAVIFTSVDGLTGSYIFSFLVGTCHAGSDELVYLYHAKECRPILPNVIGMLFVKILWDWPDRKDNSVNAN